MKQIRLSGLLLYALGFVSVVICAQFGKPIWIDEIGQFALAGIDSTSEAWSVFRKSVGGLNHGQTGAYYMISYGLLRLMGASLFAVRLPTYLFSFFLFVAARHLFCQWRLSFRWQLWGFLAIFATPVLGFYMAEGRSYLPLASCTVGVLAYYFTPLAERKRPMARFVGYTGVIGGALFHPYFSVYWAYAGAATFVLTLLRGVARPTWRSLLVHLDVRLSAIGTFLYFGIGYLTWLSHRNSPSMGDPFQWLPKEIPVHQHVLIAHFQFVNGGISAFLFLLTFSSLAIYGVRKLREDCISLFGAQLITWGGLGLTALISYISYRNNYWVLHRQWVASVALCVLGSTWFVAQVSGLLPRLGRAVWTLLAFAMVLSHAYTLGAQRIAYSQHLIGDQRPWFLWTYFTRPHAPPGRLAALPYPQSNDEIERMAEINIEEGGPVTKRLLIFYGYSPEQIEAMGK